MRNLNIEVLDDIFQKFEYKKKIGENEKSNNSYRESSPWMLTCRMRREKWRTKRIFNTAL